MTKEVNKELLDFFTARHKRGIIGLVGTNDPVGLAIRSAQKRVTSDGKPSLWSHCFLCGELRLDRRGAGESNTRSPYIFESDLVLAPLTSQVKNGAQENWIGKWCTDKVECAAVVDFGLSDEQTDDVVATALQLVDDQLAYPIRELLGTWWAIVMEKRWKPNPVDDEHAMYCSSFVRYCYQKAQKDFLGSNIHITNTAPEDIAREGIRQGALTRFS